MAKIESPVKGFEGVVGSVAFTDGKAETDDENLIAYFERAGYTVDGKIGGELVENDELQGKSDDALAELARSGQTPVDPVTRESLLNADGTRKPGVDPGDGGQPPIEEPSKDWTNAQLETYLDAKALKYTKGSTKADLLEAIEVAEPKDGADKPNTDASSVL